MLRNKKIVGMSYSDDYDFTDYSRYYDDDDEKHNEYEEDGVGTSSSSSSSSATVGGPVCLK